MMNWLTKNWPLKVISLVLAVGLWYYAVSEEGIQVTRIVPIEIKVQNPQMSILKSSTRAVQVTFMAPRGLVSNITAEDLQAVHNISADINKSGDYSFHLEPGDIKVKTPQIRILQIEPQNIQVTLDELIVKKMAIKPQFVGEAAFGYSVKSEEIQLNPNAVLIEGPKGKLEKLDSVLTERINLVGRTRSFRQTVGLDLPANVKLVGAGEALVDLYVPINEESEEKNLEQVPVRVVQGAGRDTQVEVTPPKISFILKGSKKQLQNMTPETIFAYVDVTKFQRGEYDLPVEFFLPENVMIKGDPIKVKVSLKK